MMINITKILVEHIHLLFDPEGGPTLWGGIDTAAAEIAKMVEEETRSLRQQLEDKDRALIRTVARLVQTREGRMSDRAVEMVFELHRLHEKTWRDRDDTYWFARLVQEVGELASSLIGDHRDPPEWELSQIASICLNWLELRVERGGKDEGD